MAIILSLLSSIVLIGITGCPRQSGKNREDNNIDKLPTKMITEDKVPDFNVREKIRPTKWMKTNWITATNKTDFKAEYQTTGKSLDEMYDYFDLLFDNWAQNIIEGNTFSVSMNDPDERVDIHGRIDDKGIIKWSLKYQKFAVSTK